MTKIVMLVETMSDRSSRSLLGQVIPTITQTDLKTFVLFPMLALKLIYRRI